MMPFLGALFTKWRSEISLLDVTLPLLVDGNLACFWGQTDRKSLDELAETF
jgi:hypothetical protein